MILLQHIKYVREVHLRSHCGFIVIFSRLVQKQKGENAAICVRSSSQFRYGHNVSHRHTTSLRQVTQEVSNQRAFGFVINGTNEIFYSVI